MNEKKMGKLINIPEERWGAKRSSSEDMENKEYKIINSLNFGFLRVPFDVDGVIDELYDVKNKRIKKSGVENMKEIEVDSIPGHYGMHLNSSDVSEINNETNGALLRFIKGGEGGRYILLAGRENDLEKLRSYITKVSNEFNHKFLEVFVKNADLAIEKYGEQAALIIV